MYKVNSNFAIVNSNWSGQKQCRHRSALSLPPSQKKKKKKKKKQQQQKRSEYYNHRANAHCHSLVCYPRQRKVGQNGRVITAKEKNPTEVHEKAFI